MGQITPLVHSFNAGEVSVSALGRVDQEKAKLWAETQENLLPFTIGKGMMRPGTAYLGVNVNAANRTRGIEFVKSLDDVAGLEFTTGKLRVWVDDALVTRAAVTSTVTNGDFSSSAGWTLTTTGGAIANINSSVSGALWMACPYRGGQAICTRAVTTSSAGTQHALRIVVTRGPVTFRCGSASGGDNYIEETVLDTGTHSLAFTPSGTYHVYFTSKREPGIIVDSIQVEAAGVVEFTAPWTEDELDAIQYDQSGDIVFLAHTNWQQRKIERRGDASWSLVLYQTEDGPFTTLRTADVTLTPGSTRGNTTLTADSAFFRPEHVGALFRLTHDRFNATFGLAGNEQYTDTWRVAGINTDDYNDRVFAYTVGGTWTPGVLRFYRSVTDDETGFNTFRKAVSTADIDITANVGQTFNDDDDDNLIAWYRLGFQATAWNGGEAEIAIQYAGYGGSGICRVTSYVSATQVSIEVLADFKNTTATHSWLEGEWSDHRGWPSAVSFHDGRLIWDREDKFRASESDDFEAFNLDTEGDSGSIQRNIATSGAVFRANALLSLSRLIVLTDGAEVPVRSDAFDAPVTPTNVAFKNASTVGSGPYSPEKIDKYGFYIARSGIKLYKLVYNFEQQDYDSEDVTELHEDLGEDHDGFKEMAVQRHPQPWLWAPMGDGQVAVLLHSPKHQLSSLVRVVTDGVVESVYVLPAAIEDRVYLWVRRTINGSTVRYLEKLCLRSEARGRAVTKLADAGVFAAGPVSSVTAAHLAAETGLVGWATDGDGDQVVLESLSANGAGLIALGATYTNVFVGLPYVGKYKSAKLAYGAQGGTALLQNKIISQMGLLLADTHRDAIKVGKDFDHLETFQIRSDSGAVLSSSNVVKDSHDAPLQPAGGSWNTDSRLCMQVNAGHPATLLGLVMTVKANEK